MSLKSKQMTLNVSKMVSSMVLLDRVVMPAKIKMGLALAGAKLMLDTVTDVPTAPIRRAVGAELVPYGGERLAGGLRGSGAVFVDGKKTTNSALLGRPIYQPLVYGGEPRLPMRHEACVVFNAPYAMEQHERWEVKTENTAGTHYLSRKLYDNAMEYATLIAGAIKL